MEALLLPLNKHQRYGLKDGGSIQTSNILIQYWLTPSINIVLEMVDDNKLLIYLIKNPLCVLLFYQLSSNLSLRVDERGQ